jgi:uncharacterized protein YneF (UPF0154 family)
MSYLIQFKEVLRLIPTGVWLAIVGLLSAILGAVIGQWGVSRQLRHDSDQRRLDREMSIRREVYLAAVEGVAQLQEYLGSFAKTDMAVDEHEALSRGAFGKINKVYLVAQLETISTVLGIYDAFSSAAVGLGEKKLEIMLLAERAKRSAADSERATQHTQQVGVAVGAAGQSGRGDLLEPLIAELKTAETESQALLSLVSAANDRLNEAKIRLIAEVSNEAQEFGKASELALLSVRRELGFQIDEEAFRRMMSESGQRTQQEIAKWVQKLEALAEQASREFGTTQP